MRVSLFHQIDWSKACHSQSLISWTKAFHHNQMRLRRVCLNPHQVDIVLARCLHSRWLVEGLTPQNPKWIAIAILLTRKARGQASKRASAQCKRAPILARLKEADICWKDNQAEKVTKAQLKVPYSHSKKLDLAPGENRLTMLKKTTSKMNRKSSTKTNSSTKALNRARPCNKQKKWIDIARPAHTQAASKAWRATRRANEQVKELAKRQARDTVTPMSLAVVIRLVKISSNRKHRLLWSPSTSRRGPQTNRRLIQKSKTLILKFQVLKARNMQFTNSKTKHPNSTRPINTRKPSAQQARG